MKNVSFIICLIVIGFLGYGQNIGFNDNSSDPDGSAIVDINSNSKGLLIPRISLDSTGLATPVSNPATSLLVYNTATNHDVSPGYYFWNGTLWERIETSRETEINLATVLKNADATLLKSETMVLATGNTTLTLPEISSVDNGLEIVVKHIGLHTDLVKVKPAQGQQIDDNDSLMLTRWNGKIFLAYNGNWVVKYKDSRVDNLFDISSSGSFTSIAEVLEFLEAHMYGPAVVRLGAGTFEIPSTLTIDLPYPVTFQGLSFGESILDCPSGDTAFNAISECYFKMLVFNGGETPGIGINLTGEDTYYEIKDGYFYGFSKAMVISNSADFWLFEVDFDSCTVAAIEVDAGIDKNTVFRTSECDFYNCNAAITLKSGGPLSEVSIISCTFYNFNVGQIGINYIPSNGSDNFRFTSLIIQNNSFNNIGSFCTGFDFSRSDGRDADVFMENNAGMASTKPHCKVGVSNNLNGTSIGTANTWYKAADFSSYTSYSTKWTIGNNRITYQSTNTRDGVAFLSGNIRCDHSPRILNVAIVKNGNPAVRYGETTVRIPANNSGQSFQFSTNVYLVDMSKNDYFEIWISSNSSGDILTIDDLNWYTDSH